MTVITPQKNKLDELSNPKAYQDPVHIEGQKVDRLKHFLKKMIEIRYVEQEIASMVKEKEVFCPTHLAVGQEAVAVGISEHLTKDDRVFSGHRCHAHYLALEGSVYKLLAEILGRDTGCSKGMGGSMHLHDEDVGFKGSVPLVGATIPLAVGAGLAAQLEGSKHIGVTYFGDGAAEEGVLHESMNLAAAYKIPVLFVCENNLFSSHLDIHLRQPNDRVARYAEAHQMMHATIDGNDVVKVSETAKEMISRIRNGEGPAFLEVVTYRHLGHVGPNEDVDVGVKRKMDDIVEWKKRDGIVRLEQSLIDEGLMEAHEIKTLHDEILASIKEQRQEALKAPFPEKDELLKRVFVEKSEHGLRKKS